MRVLQPIEWDAFFFSADESVKPAPVEEEKSKTGERQSMIEKQSEDFYKRARAIYRSDSTMKEEEYLFVGENEQTEGFFGRVNSIDLYLDKTIDNENLKRLLCHEYDKQIDGIRVNQERSLLEGRGSLRRQISLENGVTP